MEPPDPKEKKINGCAEVGFFADSRQKKTRCTTVVELAIPRILMSEGRRRRSRGRKLRLGRLDQPGPW